MKLKIKVHANSSQEKVEKISGNDVKGRTPKNFLEDFYWGHYEVWLKEKPTDGKANLSLIKILKKHFGKDVQIKSGFSSRKKIVEVY